MEIKYDFSELERFVDKLGDFENFETSMMTATKEIAKVLHKYLLQLTPVDTGNLRKMWSAGDNLLFTVTQEKGGYTVTFINRAVNKRSLSDRYPNGYMYGVAVNNGHRSRSGSWVKGKFFVDKSVVLTETQLEKIVRKELEKWWRESLNG